MKRVKKPKKNQEPQTKVSTHFIMKVILPCVMLACKDTFNLKEDKPKDLEKLEVLGNKIQHYIDLIADGSVSPKELSTLMTIEDRKRAMTYLDIVTEEKEDEEQERFTNNNVTRIDSDVINGCLAHVKNQRPTINKIREV